MKKRVQQLYKDERGGALPFTLVMIIAIFLVTGFMVDAGRFLTARRELNDIANQAALASAQHMSRQQTRQGQITLSREAEEAGNLYLSDSGTEGVVTSQGQVVEVEVTSTFAPKMFIGFGTRKITGRGSARPVTAAEPR